jgi:hypothetical protein
MICFTKTIGLAALSEFERDQMRAQSKHSARTQNQKYINKINGEKTAYATDT